VTGNGAYEEEMNEVALFETALRLAVPTRPDPMIARDLVPRLAQVARAATIEAETQASRRGARGAGRRARSRLALVARVGIAVALIPVVLAGLAFAGVTVPAPARDAFDSLGIMLPNQPSEERGQKPAGEDSQGTGNDVSDAAKTNHGQQGGNSAAVHQHAREQRAKAKGKAVGHQRGKAIGLNDATPPGQSGDTGAPDHSNAGGSAQSQSVRASPRPKPPPFPPANSRDRGQSTHPGGGHSN
jgi:cell division protein FtsN